MGDDFVWLNLSYLCCTIQVSCLFVYFICQIFKGHIQYHTSTLIIRIDDVRVDDGVWHNFQAEWKNNEIVISLDHGRYTVSAVF